jgi:hypothetical protein
VFCAPGDSAEELSSCDLEHRAFPWRAGLLGVNGASSKFSGNRTSEAPRGDLRAQGGWQMRVIRSRHRTGED